MPRRGDKYGKLGVGGCGDAFHVDADKWRAELWVGSLLGRQRTAVGSQRVRRGLVRWSTHSPNATSQHKEVRACNREISDDGRRNIALFSFAHLAAEIVVVHSIAISTVSCLKS